jgi:hypothetical protein
LFQKAVTQERAAGNLEEAIKLYQRVATEFASDRALAWSFAYLGHRFRPFHKGLKDFSSVCIERGVAKNPFLPSNVT